MNLLQFALTPPTRNLQDEELKATQILQPQSALLEHALPSGAAHTLEALDPGLQGIGAGIGTLGMIARLFQSGGDVTGGNVTAGNPRSTQDDVLAKLSHGEFVVNREAVQHFGTVLKLINKTFQPGAREPDPQTAAKLATELFKIARRMHTHGRTGQRTTQG